MLVLTRKIGGSIIIGDDIKVTVLATSGLSVKIGIDAHENISVHREEIYNKIQQEKKEINNSVNKKNDNNNIF